MATEFTQAVWNLAQRIPKGKVTTYALIARALGQPKTARAVGNALNKNRKKSVPCHRVIKSDGCVGGFARGTAKKVKLLKSEGVSITDRRIASLEKYLFKDF